MEISVRLPPTNAPRAFPPWIVRSVCDGRALRSVDRHVHAALAVVRHVDGLETEAVAVWY